MKINPKHQHLYRVAAIYMAAAWLVVQTVMSLTPVFDWPPIFGFGILFMLIMGYPIVLMMFWVYQVTHRTRGRDMSNQQSTASDDEGKGFQLILSVLLGLALMVVLLDVFFLVDGVPIDQTAISATRGP